MLSNYNMTLFEYISLFVAILFIILYNIWRRNKNVLIPNWPIIGMLPSILHNQSHIHDFVTSVLKHHGGTFLFKGPWFTNIANFILTSDPMNVHHITSKNFINYGKGSDFHEIFEILGGGIFNLDSNEWKQERTLLHSLLKRKSFEIFLQQNTQKKLEDCLLPFLDHAYKGVQVIDLQDILERFTFDIACTFLFGLDPNCLDPYKFNELSDISYVKAVSEMEDLILSRHYIPKCIWKLQRWLGIGQEKKGKVAKENIHQFLNKCETYIKVDEDADESHSCLLKELMKEGIGKRGKTEKYIRDTALNLLVAGNGTISSGLSWFFWLVSTHPTVEAKIIQEIKDNYFTQEENSITDLRVEELDKLVYLHGAICEALRLYSPVSFEHKCAMNSDILPSGDHVSPNTKLIYSLYAMGRMEEIWGDDCMEFKPERWISEKGQIIHVPSYKFIAFNAGPRSCIGKDISLVQMKMVAVAMLWKFHIHVVEGHSVIPRVSVILRMEHGLKVNVSKRSI
ncbi:alkane hydroxylase MAH1-like [Vicia villosa]|uniref:alkane hydroxylase MAH1-like n=1 Tax=Vicia villosa TaxID=3911 RepID=UPI00273B631C|nr:alkane hydroxylase MAH1-like [Vicia villosa]